jgi:hypothetical protein
MDISQQGEEIALVLNEEGLVPALEKVPDALMAKVELLRVEGLQRQHDAGESHGPARQSEVDVIVHQAVTQDSELKPRPTLSKSL